MPELFGAPSALGGAGSCQGGTVELSSTAKRGAAIPEQQAVKGKGSHRQWDLEIFRILIR